MQAVIEDLIVKSSVQDLDIPGVDLGTYLRAAWRNFKDRTALIDNASDERLTYEQLEEICNRVAAGLKSLNFKPGDIAGLHSGPNLNVMFAFYGTIFAGGSIVSAKESLTKAEVRHQFNDSSPCLVFCDEQNAEKTLAACKCVPSVKKLVVFGHHGSMEPFSTLKKAPLDMIRPIPTVDPRGILTVLYSSGTTGLPKGTLISHKNCIAQTVVSGNKGSRLIEQDDVMLGSLQLTHVSGVHLYTVILSVGASIIVLAKRDPDHMLQAAERYKATACLLFPTELQKILQSNVVDKYNVSSIRKLITGGSTASSSVARAIVAKLGIECYRHIYGMTESVGSVTVSPAGIEDYTNVGTPNAMTQIKVVDVHTGNKLGPKQLGEIRIKAPYCVSGYINNLEATADLYDAEGFMKSGDLGYYTEDGMFYIVDRIKDLIKCMDQQVSPAELEEILQKHESVKEAVVAGVPHPEYGEAARAFVVLFQDCVSRQAVEAGLRRLVADRLAPHKHLHGGIQFLTNLPKSDSGKHLRRALRDAFIKSLGNDIASLTTKNTSY